MSRAQEIFALLEFYDKDGGGYKDYESMSHPYNAYHSKKPSWLSRNKKPLLKHTVAGLGFGGLVAYTLTPGTPVFTPP